ncbi:MAG: DUF2207 domain-containing protein [Gaiellaceae bacterium]
MGRFAFVVLAALALAPNAPASSPNISTAHVVLTIEPNGVVDVLEDVTLATPIAYTAAQEVSMHAGELFAEPSVVVDERKLRSGDRPSNGMFLISRGKRGVRISWQQPAGTSTVRLGYRLALLGTAYDDVVDMDVPLWESDWPGRVALLTGFLRLPRVSIGTLRAWVEGTYSGGTLSRSQSDVRVRIHDIPPKRSLRLHVVFPRTVLTGVEGVVVKRGDGLAAILAARNRHSTANWWWWTALAVLAVGLSGALLRTARSRRQAQR